MGGKLNREAVERDVAAVRKLLAKRTAETDPIGFAQFSSRLRVLEQELAELHDTPANRANLTVYFAGSPVQGSRGIKADFAGRAVEAVQELVSKQFAQLEVGGMARTGPVAHRDTSDMILTEIARGSVGLVLEEADRNESLTKSELSTAVAKVAEDIDKTADTDATQFDEMLVDVDARYFAALKHFFELLDDARATVRLVDNEREVALDAVAVHRGRERTDAATVRDEDDVRLQGRLFLLPVARRFELRIGAGESIHGNVSRDYAQQELERLLATTDVVNRDWVVRLRKRTVARPNREPLVRFTLLGLIEPANPDRR